MEICIITLGCKVNQYESHELCKLLRTAGHEVTEKRGHADLYIINTCAITQFAEKKSRYEMARICRDNPDAQIIVCGCASQFDSVQFECSNVVKVYGTDKSKILSAVLLLEKEKKRNLATKKENGHIKNRFFIKVQDGCNNFCSYCIVPHLRGRSRSRPMEEVVSEIKMLDSRIQEITLTGIDLSSYGLDMGKTLGDLCQAVDKLDRPFRLSSLEVGIITTELLHILSQCKNFLPHFHLPLQSGSDSVLTAMNRKYTAVQYLEKVNMVRKFFPQSTLTTDVIVGFPTETETNFNETLNLFKTVRFTSAHIFPYSRRSGTAAAKLKPLQPSIVTDRTKTLTAVQSQITNAILKTFVGKTLRVLVESRKGDIYNATSSEYLPVKIQSHKPLPFEWQTAVAVGSGDGVIVAFPQINELT